MLKQRYPNTPIHQLTYIDKKRNPAENTVDAMKNTKSYYLIDKQDYQLFIAVENKQFMTTRVVIDTSKNVFYIGNIQLAFIRKNI
ncbi:MAG: hypothetical protein LUG60_06965 [Erysipelotrichaceae bacterium]|nr:hypothetical protein [Erysipelotrichaceae bacterium]